MDSRAWGATVYGFAQNRTQLKQLSMYVLMYIYIANSLCCTVEAINVLCAQSCPTLCIPWTTAHQAPLSMEFSRQEYWSRLPFPLPRSY